MSAVTIVTIDTLLSFLLAIVVMVIDKAWRRAASRAKGWELPEEPSVVIFAIIALGIGGFALVLTFLGVPPLILRLLDSPLVLFFYLGATRKWPWIARIFVAFLLWALVEAIAFGATDLVLRLTHHHVPTAKELEQ